MTHTALISTADLVQGLANPNWIIIDARFSLAETEAGRQAYQQAHIPGAIYAHLDEDLSGPIIPGQTSRHPLPEIMRFSQTLSQWGIDAETQVVVYDNMGGFIAARLWWMLRWLGHSAVAVLDGGWPQWAKEGHPTKAGIETGHPRTFIPQPQPDMVVNVAAVEAISSDVVASNEKPATLLVDCRARPRYRGEEEPLDPVAGHIPGAICLPVSDNLAGDGRFRPEAELQGRFDDLLANFAPEQLIFYCGSGVTAAHNLLALAHLGLDGARMYAGSWSEWITDSDRPIEIGGKGQA